MLFKGIKFLGSNSTNSSTHYIVCGDLSLSVVLFLLFSCDFNHVKVLSYQPNRLFSLTLFLSRFFNFQISFHHYIFDDIEIENECLYRVSKKLTLEVCDFCYKEVTNSVSLTSYPFLKYLFLRYFRTQFKEHLSITRQLLAFSSLHTSLSSQTKLLLSCSDQYYLQKLVSFYNPLSSNFKLGITLPFSNLQNLQFHRLFLVLFSYIITRLPILSYRPSCCDVLPAKLSIIKSLDAPYGDSLSRSVTNYSLFDYLGVQPFYYFRGGSLLSISSNKDTNSSTY